MIILVAIFLATVVTNSQEKYIELLSNEEFQVVPARRAGEGVDSSENNNLNHIVSEESHSEIRNREDKSYIPDIDITSANLNRRNHAGKLQENSTNSAKYNESLVTIYNEKENTTGGQKVHQGKNVTDFDHKTMITLTTVGKAKVKNNHSKIELKNAQEKNTLDLDTLIQASDFEQAENEDVVLISLIATDPKNKSTSDTQAREHKTKVRMGLENMVKNSETSLKVTVSVKKDISVNTLADKYITDLAIDTANKESADVFNTPNNQIIKPITKNTANVNTATENYNAVTKNENLENITETTANGEETVSTKIPKKKTEHVNNLINNIEDITKVEKCLYCYRVYEILSPSNRRHQPFLRDEEPIKDQLYLAPVGNYSPNFTSYHFENHLRPIKLKDSSKELIKWQIDEKNKDLHDTAKSNKIINKFNYQTRRFGVVKKEYKRTSTRYDKKLRTHKPKDVQRSHEATYYHVPELMNAVLGAKSLHIPSVNTNGNNMNNARIDNLYDFINVRDDIVNYRDKPVRKRFNHDTNINIHINVLRNFLREDSKALKQYDWLATTVQIQTALMKILELINCVRQSEPIHPTDLLLLKYIVSLHKLSLVVQGDNKVGDKFNKRVKILKRNKKKRIIKSLKEERLIKGLMLYIRMMLPYLVEEDEFSHVYEFLIDVQDGLFDLHEAIRQIADVTKFNHQNWYDNLKQLYLSADEKHLRELLLHISMSRLVELLEHSLKHELDSDIIQFVKSNKMYAKKTVEEMLFIDYILNDFKVYKK